MSELMDMDDKDLTAFLRDYDDSRLRLFTSNDMDFVTRQVAVGGLIWDDKQMAGVARRGVTHIINLNDADDTFLAEPHGIRVLHNYTDDDLEPKPPGLFMRGVAFAKSALANRDSKLLIHCAAGVHRAPMMALAVLCSDGWKLRDAMRHIKRCRPCVGFPNVYIESVVQYLAERTKN